MSIDKSMKAIEIIEEFDNSFDVAMKIATDEVEKHIANKEISDEAVKVAQSLAEARKIFFEYISKTYS
ncbi:MAG: hypothetical protein JXR18_00415 [Neptuniibacter sp.]